MKTVYTYCVFSLVVLLMIGCAKEESPKPSTSNTTYNGGGGSNPANNNPASNSNGGNNTKPNSGGNNQLPQNHPVGAAAACGGCHKGYVTVPDWAIDGIAKEEDDMLKVDAKNEVTSVKGD